MVMNAQEGNHDKDWYGDSAETFVPTRFMGNDTNLPHLTFGAGNRICPAVALSNHPEQVLTLCVIGIALMTPSEQAYWKRTVNFPFNKPVDDGSHLMKTWKYLEESGGDAGGKNGLDVKDLDFKHQEFLNHARAWDGRGKIYTCVFDVDLMASFVRVKCPVLSLCARDDVLFELVHHVAELVSAVGSRRYGICMLIML